MLTWEWAFHVSKKKLLKKTGRTHLAIVQGYRDIDGKNKHKTVQRVGYLDELQKEYEDPIAHFSAIAETMDKERKATRQSLLQYSEQPYLLSQSLI